MDIYFLNLALSAASPVVRVLDEESQFKGTGFMVSNSLLLTNNHVLCNPKVASACQIEFNYELDAKQKPKPVTRFALCPSNFFLTNPERNLDFTLTSVGECIYGNAELNSFGYCPLTAHVEPSVGECANIIQHPKGEYKQIVLRESRILAATKTMLYYAAGTNTGSSGSPVFNDDFEVIALHHYGEPIVDKKPNGISGDVNEGIRISAITEHLKGQRRSLNGSKRRLLDSVLTVQATVQLKRSRHTFFDKNIF